VCFHIDYVIRTLFRRIIIIIIIILLLRSSRSNRIHSEEAVPVVSSSSSSSSMPVRLAVNIMVPVQGSPYGTISSTVVLVIQLRVFVKRFLSD